MTSRTGSKAPSPAPSGALCLCLAFLLSPAAFANIFGPDDRRLLTPDDKLSAVGLISCQGTTRRPTATLLAPENSDHRNIIVTVAHAFLAPDDTQLTPCDFLPGGDPALAIAVSFTYLGTANPVGNWTQDWAVAHLARPAPETFQPLTPEILSVSEADDARANGTAFSLAGHNGETGPLMLSDNCGPKPKRNADINRFDDRAFNHDCDMMPGWSGGPLMVERDGKRYVIAVNATELNALVTVAGEAYRGAYNANTAVRMDGAFYEAFLRLTRDGPPRRTGPAPASCLVWQPPPIAPRRC